MNYDDSSGSEQTSANNKTPTVKRNCHRHSPHQIQILETFFKECPHPDESQRKILCQDLKLEMDQIKFWFQNKRTQTKTQDERSTNLVLRKDNETLKNENEAIHEALKNVRCPPCGGPALGEAERKRNLQNLRQENAYLKAKLSALKEQANQPTMVDSFAAANMELTLGTRVLSETDARYVYEPPNPFGGLPVPPSLAIELRQHLSPLEMVQMSETAAIAVEELKHLLFNENFFWVTSVVDGTYVINQDNYQKLSSAITYLRSSSARVESSKAVTVVPMEATKLLEILIDVEKKEVFFPTILNSAKTIHSLGADFPINETSDVLQLTREQQHILSPLVSPREFMIVRCCQQLEQGLWIVADMSHNVNGFDVAKASCYKRPSGCLLQALPNGYTKVTWIEHVEVDDKMNTHPMYKELLSSGSFGYSAHRWILSLERMCERMAFHSASATPIINQSQVYATWHGRQNMMKLGERILKDFFKDLIMSGKFDFPHQPGSGVRICIRTNIGNGQIPGVIVSAASCLALSLTPLQVFSVLQNINTRSQWDALCNGQIAMEVDRIKTGSNETNFVNIIRPIDPPNYGSSTTEQTWNKRNDMVIVQDCHMDALGGTLVYAPLDQNTFKMVAFGKVDPSQVPILPSGFIISPDGSRRIPAADGSSSSSGGRGGGTLLTVAFQILVSGDGHGPSGYNEVAVDTANQLISTTIQKIKRLLSYYPNV